MSHSQGKLIISIISPIFFLALWELAAATNLIDRRFFPAPSSVLLEFFAMAASGQLWRHIAASLVRISIGFFLGAVPGVILGLIMGLNSWVRAALYPIVAAIYPIPKSAIVPLALLIFGLGEASKIFVIATGVIFLVLINTMSGVMNISPVYLDVGRNFNAGRFGFFRTIALPGALPMIFTGLRLGLGTALILIVIAEMVGAKVGIGFMIWQSWDIFEVEQMYVGLFIISFFGFVIFQVLEFLERKLIPWR